VPRQTLANWPRSPARDNTLGRRTPAPGGQAPSPLFVIPIVVVSERDVPRSRPPALL